MASHELGQRSNGSRTLLTIMTTVLTIVIGAFFTLTFSQHSAIGNRAGIIEKQMSSMMSTDVATTTLINGLQFRVETLERGRDENRRNIEELQRDVARLIERSRRP